MKFQVECGVLLKILNQAQALIERRQIEHICTRVLMQVEGSKLKLYARNNVVRLVSQVPAKVAQCGELALDPRHLSSLLKEMKASEMLSLETDEANWLFLKQNKARAKIVAEEAIKYPVFSSSREGEFSRIQAPKFFDMINKVSYGVADADSKHEAMKGVYFEFLKNQHRLVSTDSYRLSAVDRDLGSIKRESFPEGGVVIPSRGVACLKELLVDFDGEFELAVSGKELIVWVDESCLMIDLIKDSYPSTYRKMIISPEKLVNVSREALLASLRRVVLLTDQKSLGLILELMPGKLRITSTKSKIGSSKEEIDVDYKGKKLRIGFNGQYMLDALKHIEGDEIEMGFQEDYLPSVMRYKKDAGHVSVVMPMQL